MVVLVTIGFFLFIVGIFSFPLYLKAIYFPYLGYIIYLFFHKDSYDPLFIYKVFGGGVVLFILFCALTYAETLEAKKKVIYFFLEYGGLYMAMTMGLKYLLFAFTGFAEESWNGIDLLVTILPYKWVLYIIVLWLWWSFKQSKIFRR